MWLIGCELYATELSVVVYVDCEGPRASKDAADTAGH